MSRSIDIPSKLRAAHPDLSDVSESLGGTIYGTTPGGTRIQYKREDLMQLSKSPLARARPPGTTPRRSIAPFLFFSPSHRPPGMPELPGVTTDRASALQRRCCLAVCSDAMCLCVCVCVRS